MFKAVKWGVSWGKNRFLEGEIHAKVVDFKNGHACMGSFFGVACGGVIALWLVQVCKKRRRSCTSPPCLFGLTGCKAFPGSAFESAGGATLLKYSKIVSNLPEPAAGLCKILINLNCCGEAMIIQGVHGFMQASDCSFAIENFKKIEVFPVIMMQRMNSTA